MFPRFVYILFLLSLVGCSSKPESNPNGNKNKQTNGSQISSKKVPKEEATTKDGRWIFSLSNDAIIIKGSFVKLENLKKADLLKVLGDPDRLVDMSKNTQLLLWAKKGIRAYDVKPLGGIESIDFLFECGTSEIDKKYEPRKPFESLLKVRGMEITSTTTKKSLQDSGRITQPIEKRGDGIGPGFHIRFSTYTLYFDQTKDEKTLKKVRITVGSYASN